LLVEVTHDAVMPGFFDTEKDQRFFYRNAFQAIPAGVAYRPPRRTPRPVISGVVTGIIQTGADGETGGIAQVDDQGRYLVQLHFDTAQHGQQKASHRVRMAQPFAGPSYGMHFPLRRGTEVLVAFTNGDPDRPVIVGALSNATSPSPVVASNATAHQIKSPSGAMFTFGSKS
jgi:type VI secretion system secreted protein VgrG